MISLTRGMAPTMSSHELPAHKLVQENLPYLEIDNKKEISIISMQRLQKDKNKEIVVHIYNGILLSHTKKHI